MSEPDQIDMMPEDELRTELRAAVKLLFECRKRIATLEATIEQLRRGEFICIKCGLRKDSDHECQADF
jgi:hypothetical protein